jgi:hypothetical protein
MHARSALTLTPQALHFGFIQTRLAVSDSVLLLFAAKKEKLMHGRLRLKAFEDLVMAGKRFDVSSSALNSQIVPLYLLGYVNGV